MAFSLTNLAKELEAKKKEKEEAASAAKAAVTIENNSIWPGRVGIAQEQIDKERENEAEGFPTWRARDFVGSYHLCRINNRFPIPGTAVQLERLRLKALDEKDERLGSALRAVEERCQANAKFKGEIVLEHEQFKAAYGPRFYLHSSIEKVLNERAEESKRMMKRYSRENAAFTATNTPEVIRFLEFIAKGDVPAVQKMLQTGEADANCIDASNNGHSALMQACKNLRVAIVAVLLEFGADPCQKDLTGATCLHVLWHKYRTQSKKNSLSRIVYIRNMQTILEQLIEAGIQLGMRNQEQDTFLHIAAAEQTTELCWTILENGTVSLLDELDGKGRTPIQRCPDSKHESSKLLASWKGLVKANKLTDFHKAWMTYINRTELGSGLAFKPNAGKVLHDLKVVDWSRESMSLFRECILDEIQRDHLNPDKKELRENKSKDGFDFNADSLCVEDLIRKAQTKYTESYRKKVEAARQKMKPSDRKLTLIEYLVGSKGRKQAAKLDKEREVRGAKQTVLRRRLNAARTLLTDKYKGGPLIRNVAERDPDYEAIHQAKAGYNINDCINNASLHRPWTTSALNRVGGDTRPGVLAEVARNSINKPTTSNTFATTSQRFATRKVKVPDMNFKVLETKDEIEDRELRQKATKKTAHKTRATVLLADVAPGMGFKQDGVKAASTAKRVVNRRAAIKYDAQDTKKTTSSAVAYQKEAANTTHTYSSSKKRGHGKETDPCLLPPEMDERKVFTSVKREQGQKTHFSKIEIKEALDTVLKRIGKQHLPESLYDAIVRSVSADEGTAKGMITISELRSKFERFYTFITRGGVSMKAQIDTAKALDELSACLSTKHRFDLLHASFKEFADYGSKDKHRPSPFEEKPVTSEPWYASVVKNPFPNAKRSRHEENPLNGPLFQPSMLNIVKRK